MRPQGLTAGAARCMKSQRFTQGRWSAGDAAAIFNLRPPSRTDSTGLSCHPQPALSEAQPAEVSFHAGFYSKTSYQSPFKKMRAGWGGVKRVMFSVRSIWQREMKAPCSWWRRISQTDWIISLSLIDSERCTRLLISLKNEFVSWKIEFSSLPLKPSLILQHSVTPANLSAHSHAKACLQTGYSASKTHKM